MNHTLSDSQLEEMIKSAVNSSGPLPPDEKFSQLISALRELQERRKADSEPVAEVLSNRPGNDTSTIDRALPVGTQLYRHAQPVLEIESEPVFTLEVASADYKGQKLGNHFGFITLDAARELKEGNYQLYTAQPVPVVPDGYVMVPMRLTAENGAKGALSGEFSETKFVNCPECFGDDECETCDGSGRIEITVPVTWTTIKEIWAKGVEHFAAAPQEPKP